MERHPGEVGRQPRRGDDHSDAVGLGSDEKRIRLGRRAVRREYAADVGYLQLVEGTETARERVAVARAPLDHQHDGLVVLLRAHRSSSAAPAPMSVRYCTPSKRTPATAS